MSTLQQLLTLKQTNLNLIVDLLNTPNVDTKQLQAARDTQNFINYQLDKYYKFHPHAQLQPNISCTALPHTLFKRDKDDTSSFASLNGGSGVFKGVDLERYSFAKQAASLFPKQTANLSMEDQFFRPGIRNKEELIFKPSQEQLNGVNRPVLPEDIYQNVTRGINTYIQPMPNIVPVKPEFKGDDLSRQTEFKIIHGLETEIEQNVKADLAKLTMELNKESPEEDLSGNVNTPRNITGIKVPDCEDAREDIYDNPYDEYQ